MAYFSNVLYLPFAILLLPLLSFIVLIEGKKINKWAGHISVGFTGISLLLSLWLCLLLWNKELFHIETIWFLIGKHPFSVGITIDHLSLIMITLVTFISTLVQVYSLSYMHGEKHYYKYFAYLGIFTFSMLGIVTTSNLLVLYGFWELVGLSSYLLIGFWYLNDKAIKASKKAFIVNRIGDIGLLLGIMILWNNLGTLEIQRLISLLPNSISNDNTWLTLAGIGLFCGCIGKSAQFPLHIWLPDAMQGPTPASALIHAATMVAAGIYLLARVFPLLDESTLVLVACIGCITAFLGAFAASSQFDIKKILAYSTISQLGFMVMGIGVNATHAAIFHLVTHAFFKAGLFLAVGVVIHEMSILIGKNHEDPQNIKIMGGLIKIMPITFICYLLFTFSAIGIPLFAGFMSKDLIISHVWAWADLKSGQWNQPLIYLIPILAFVSTLLTAFYMTRQLIMVFLGKNRYSKGNIEKIATFDELHGPDLKMIIPIIALALFTPFFMFSSHPFQASNGWLLQSIQIIHSQVSGIDIVLLSALEHHRHTSTMIICAILALISVIFAWLRYGLNKKIPGISQNTIIYGPSRPTLLARNAFYLDQLYHQLAVHPTMALAKFCQKIDVFIDNIVNSFGVINVIIAHLVQFIDRYIIDGTVARISSTALGIGWLTKKLSTGQIQAYILISFLFFIIVVLAFVLL